MKRTADSIASSFDFNSNCAKPPMTSLASVNGPSVTLSFPPEIRTRAPCAVDRSPPSAINVLPSFASSSMSLPMASINALGTGPWFSACLTIIMYRIETAPFVLEFVSRDEPAGLCAEHGPKSPCSVDTSNQQSRIRPEIRKYLLLSSQLLARPPLTLSQFRSQIFTKVGYLIDGTNF